MDTKEKETLADKVMRDSQANTEAQSGLSEPKSNTHRPTRPAESELVSFFSNLSKNKPEKP